MTNRQLHAIEKRVTVLEKTMREITEALVTISTAFMALTTMLSSFKHEPPDEERGIKVGLN